MYAIPKDLVKEWDDIKHKALGRLDTMGFNLSATEKKQYKKDYTALLGTFDQGLKARMKTAASAKTDAEATKAAAKVVEIVDDYQRKVDAAAAKHGKFGSEYRDGVTKVLVKIRTHAVASTKSRAPIVFPKAARDAWTAALQTAKGNVAADDGNAFGGPFLNAVQVPVRNALNAVEDAGKRGDEGALAASLKTLRAQLPKAVAALGTWAQQKPTSRDKARKDLSAALQGLLEATNATAAKLGRG